MDVFLGLELRRLRKRTGKSQDAFAWEIGVSQGCLAKYELDKLPIPFDIALSIADKFNADWFLKAWQTALIVKLAETAFDRARGA